MHRGKSLGQGSVVQCIQILIQLQIQILTQLQIQILMQSQIQMQIKTQSHHISTTNHLSQTELGLGWIVHRGKTLGQGLSAGTVESIIGIMYNPL